MEMDADFSHNPEDLKNLIIEIENGNDFVIGSRYIKGGAIPQDWSLLQKLNSRWGNRFARRVAGLKSVMDCTAGFRAIRTDLLRRIDLDNLDTHGYSFQIRLLYEASKLGAKIKEVPVIFKERTRGQTKEGFWDILEFIIVSFKIRWERFRNKGIRIQNSDYRKES
jgi:dolichol-phosphate mannosyltransferase